jgi:hypothetical protein
MIFGDRVAKMKLVEQLTLITLQSAHHGSTSSRFPLTPGNHGLIAISTDFCNKICQTRTSNLQTVRKIKNKKPPKGGFSIKADDLRRPSMQALTSGDRAMNANARELGADPAVQVVRE